MGPIFKRPQNRQPQGVVQLDRSNPLTRSAAFVVVPTIGKEVVKQIAVARAGSTPPTIGGTPQGLGFKHTSGAATVSYLNLGTPTGPSVDIADGPCTFVGVFYANSTSGVAIAERNDGNSVNLGWLVGYALGDTAKPGLAFVREYSTANLRKSITETVSPGLNVLVVTHDGSNLSASVNIYLNGRLGTVFGNFDGSGTTGTDSGQSLFVGRNTFDTSHSHDGTILLSAAFRRQWSAAEVASFSSNPWQLFASPSRSLLVDVAAAAGGITGAGQIGSGEAFGSAAVGATVAPTGIASAQAFGAAAIGAGITTTGIATGEAVGAPAVGAGIAPAGIATAQAIGQPSVAASISTTGIASAEAFGLPVVAPAGIVAAGIASAEALGTPAVAASIAAVGVASGEAFGTPTVQSSGVFAAGIPSAEAFGQPALAAAINAAAIASTETFGRPVVGIPQPDEESHGGGIDPDEPRERRSDRAPEPFYRYTPPQRRKEPEAAEVETVDEIAEEQESAPVEQPRTAIAEAFMRSQLRTLQSQERAIEQLQAQRQAEAARAEKEQAELIAKQQAEEDDIAVLLLAI